MVKLRLAERGAQHKPKDGRDMQVFCFLFNGAGNKNGWQKHSEWQLSPRLDGRSVPVASNYGSMLAYPHWLKYLTWFNVICFWGIFNSGWRMARLRKTSVFGYNQWCQHFGNATLNRATVLPRPRLPFWNGRPYLSRVDGGTEISKHYCSSFSTTGGRNKQKVSGEGNDFGW